MRYVAQPAKELKPLLKLVTDVCAYVDRAYATAGPVPAGFENFDRAILMRGVNLLKATVMLSESLHWEVAASCARQMFELVLNMEALAAMPNREQGSLLYAHYGLLQQTRARIAELDYERAAGRQVDEEYAERVAAMLNGAMFDPFKGKARADGSIAWSKSWNGKTTWDMVKSSAHNIREAQYNQLFVRWSEETHATPGALLGSMFRTIGPDWTDDVLSNDIRETMQVASMTLIQFFELWMLLVNVPPYEKAASGEWFSRLNTFLMKSERLPEWASL